MKPYYHPISIHCRKARLPATAPDLELELQLVDAGTGAHRKDEYLAIDPNGLIPALEDRQFAVVVARSDAWKRTAPPAVA